MNPRALLLLVLAPLSLSAQTPDSSRLAALGRFLPSATLRLQGPSIGVVQARLREPLTDSLTLGRWRPQGRVPLAAVDSIWVLHSGVNAATAVGAVVLGLTFGIFGAELSRGFCESPNCHTTRGFIAGAGIGVIVGGTLGAMIGSADESWEKIYPPD